MTPMRVQVLVVAARESDARFASNVLSDHGDTAVVARDVPDALARLTRDRFDVALVSLSLPRGDGLALVHHLRALYPDIDVIVMAAPTEIEETAHAMALGVLTHVVLPLSGDALLVAVDRARERRILISERARFAAEHASSRRRTATYARCAAFVAETDAHAVAVNVLDACAGEVPLRGAAIYTPESPGASRYLRAAALGDESLLRASLDSEALERIDPSRPVRRLGDRLQVALVGDAELAAVVELVPEAASVAGEEEVIEALEVVAALGTAAFAAARKVDAIARTGLKDPDTSAYTFAYFGDAAGREIDRAARHGRRFGLLTLGIEGLVDRRDSLGAAAQMQLRRTIADVILDSVRDSDVLARVEDDEFDLLLPETGLLGALACRRRILDCFAGAPELMDVPGGTALDPVVGVAVYPQDGLDLGRLLRVSRRRSERSRSGPWRRMGLAGRPFWRAIDDLLGSEDDVAVGRDGSIGLHRDLLAAHDETGLARHVALSNHLLSYIGGAIAGDAIGHAVAGTLYVAGDDQLAAAVTHEVSDIERPALRAWILGPASGPGGRLRLEVADPRLQQRILLLALTELGGYALVARPLRPGTLLAFHSVDLDLVDGLVSSLQQTYHLQPEVRE